MTDHRPIRLPSPGGEIDRRDLRALIRRFLHLHRQRLRLLLGVLSPRQRDCVEVLPLLFHRNHPALPGYVGEQAPAGIRDFHIAPSIRSVCRRLFPGFDLRRRGMAEPPILALFFMGSAGTIAFTRNSDLDLWVCHRSGLDDTAIEVLQRKCREIEHWAADHDLELHCFLVDPSAFRQGRLPRLSKESSGSTQRILLLEEFYRTALHLAGCGLLWWLVPPEWETRYQTYSTFLIEKRFVDPTTLIDLGGLHPVPTSEFASAALWHLHKALESPYKSLLKLLLLLEYAAGLPHPAWLASDTKQAVHAGKMDVIGLDPYLHLYRRIERFILDQGQTELLSLVRHSFALKIRNIRPHPDFEPVLADLQRQWGWALPGGPPPSRIESVRKEWQTLATSLKSAYQRLQPLADDRDATRDELRVLTNQLQATFQPRPGKLEILRLSVAPEAQLTLSWDDASRQPWKLLRHPQSPIHRDRSLIALLAWGWRNHVISPATRWQIRTDTPLTLPELHFLNRILRRFLLLCTEPDLSAFHRPPQLQNCVLFANPAAATRPCRGALTLTSSRFDPLDYGAERRVLLKHLELLCYNSWGELEAHRHDGLAGLFDAYCWLYRHGGGSLRLSGHCFSPPTLGLRLETTYRQLCEGLEAGQGKTVLEAGGQRYRFQIRDGQLRWCPNGPAKGTP